MAREIDNELSTLEEAFDEDSKASFTDEISSISEKFNHLHVYSSESSELAIQYKKLRTHYLKLKATSEEKQDVKSIFLDSLGEMTGSHFSTRSSSPYTERRSRIHLKLPKIELPQFDGNHLNWCVFWERFHTAVDQNPDLTEEVKLTYLRSSMKDKTALEIVSPATGDTHSYTTLLDLLREEYEDKREIHRGHIKALMDTESQGVSHSDWLNLKVSWEKHLSRLKQTGQYEADYLMTSVAVLNPNPTTFDKWLQYSREYSDVPSIEVFQQFLKEQTRVTRKSVREPLSKVVTHHSHSTPADSRHLSKATRASVHLMENSSKCELCMNSVHPLYVCPSIKDAGPVQRLEMAKQVRACTNCLSVEHRFKDCTSTKRCKSCSGRHHALLHFEKRSIGSTDAVSNTQLNSSQSSPANPEARCNATHTHSGKPVTESSLLMTAQIVVQANSGKCMMLRALLDSGASTSLLTQRAATQLGLSKTRQTTWITGVQGTKTRPSRYVTKFLAECKDTSNQTVSITALLVDNIIQELPARPIPEAENWEVTRNLNLADPRFHRPGRIDVLLGMDVWSNILLSGIHTGATGEPKAINTLFGWVIAGTYSGRTDGLSILLHVMCETGEDLNDLVKWFWYIEEVPQRGLNTLTQDEQSAMDTFHNSVTRTQDSRYCVELPWKSNIKSLGREQALRCLLSTEKSLAKKGTWKPFRDGVVDYLDQDHAEAVPQSQISDTSNSTYYLPMHAVTKASSTTTKIHIVFDASARTTSGISLNNVLLSGPNIYPLIVDQVLKFRMNKIAMSAHISHMFRQILLTENDRDLHRFLFRESTYLPVKEYRMKRLTFGVTSSPSIASQTLRQVALDFADEYPIASAVVLNDFYVDNVLTGASSITTTKELRSQLNGLLLKGGFLLRKWRNSSPALLESIPEELKETEVNTELQRPSDNLKTLGIH